MSLERVRQIAVSSATLVLVSAALVLVTAPAAFGDATQAPCGTSFNPYNYSPAALSACGIATTPLSSITPMPGGGSSYNYQRPGGTTTHEYVLPSDFDGLTATSAELQAYGLPQVPTNSLPAAAAWTDMMAHFRLAPPPPFLAILPQSEAPATNAYPWAGYVATGGSGTFSYVTASYNEGDYNNTTCPNGQTYLWGGIGGYGTLALAQDGTAHNVPGLNNHEAWYSTMHGGSYSTVALNYSGNARDQMLASTQWMGSNWSFLVWDYSTNNGASASGVSGDYNGQSAEAIVEVPQDGSEQLSNFGTLQFNTVYTNVEPYPSNGLQAESPTALESVDRTGVLDAPGGIGGGGNFVVNWERCGA